MNEKNCKRCGVVLQIGPKATNKRFCSAACYRAWWDEQRYVAASQEDRITAQLGPVSALTISDEDTAWLACAIDGEGTIGIWRQRSNDRHGWRYRAIVAVFNTNREFLSFVGGLVGGKIWVKDGPRKRHYKHSWQVRIHSRVIPQFLERIKPRLIIKRKQADLVLEFCRAVAASPVHNRAMQPTFERLYQECKALNKRGTK